MIINPDRVHLQVELVLRITADQRIPPAAIPQLVADQVGKARVRIQLGVPVYQEASVQPANGYALDVRFENPATLAQQQAAAEARPATETPRVLVTPPPPDQDSGAT